MQLYIFFILRELFWIELVFYTIYNFLDGDFNYTINVCKPSLQLINLYSVYLTQNCFCCLICLIIRNFVWRTVCRYVFHSTTTSTGFPVRNAIIKIIIAFKSTIKCTWYRWKLVFKTEYGDLMNISRFAQPPTFSDESFAWILLKFVDVLSYFYGRCRDFVIHVYRLRCCVRTLESRGID